MGATKGIFPYLRNMEPLFNFTGNEAATTEILTQLKAADASSYILDIATLLADEKLSPASLKEVLHKHKIDSISNIKLELLDLLLIYAGMILDDQLIDNAEATNFNFMKRLFGIQEGDFYKHRYAAMQEVLSAQFALIYADNRVDTREAMHHVELQELFDLSYDQFLAFQKEEVNRSLKSGAEPLDLDTVKLPDNE